ncbi:MAG: molybdate ABC transporter substrate-binding protein [Alphaproteobacteria bacterium]|nr:molybdate ABC transporter substrate-binding protein [Alphaproteobacteria bacterium]
MDGGKRSVLRARAGVLLGVVLSGLVAGQPATAQSRPVVVFAAASLKTALDDIAAQWARQTGRQTRISYAASSALARQIEGGAPADLYMSADLDWMDYVAERRLIKPDSRGNLLGNRIVLIAPAASKVETKIGPGFPLRALLGDGRLAMANVEAVPAGKYGKAALEVLGSWNGVKDRVAQAENVRAALLLVARGEAPLGIVYSTDAASEPKVKTVGMFPENTHPPIVYPFAVLTNSKNAAAAPYAAFLRSAKAKAILEKHGFAVIGGPTN